MRSLIFVFALIAGWNSSLPAQPHELKRQAEDGSRQAARPNIVFILVDDLSWSDLGCYGHAYHRTPNIDRLAAEGLRFTAGYAPAPICSASRASILTGKTPARLGFEFVTKNEPGHQRLDASVPLETPEFKLNLPISEITIAERLAELGYKTAFLGKWHVSQHYQRRYLAWHPDYGPKQQGFSVAIEDFGDHPYAWSKKQSPKDLPAGVFPADSMVQQTAEFIRAQRGTQTPYFLMASSFYVHTPVRNRCQWLVKDYAEKLEATAPNWQKRVEYAAFVETLDHHVGSIVDAIDDSGQRNNTLIFFMSDNGGHPEYASNAPLRGSKWNLYEGGIRVPMIARWPGQTPAGVTNDTPVIGYDLLPTFVDMAGGEVLALRDAVDGLSVARLLQPEEELPLAAEEHDIREPTGYNNIPPSRPLIWHFPYYHPESTFSTASETIGVGDFAVSKTRPQSAIRKANYKLIQFAEDARVELYDLANDLAEQHDLSHERPSVASELTALLQQQLHSMDARRAIPRQ